MHHGNFLVCSKASTLEFKLSTFGSRVCLYLMKLMPNPLTNSHEDRCEKAEFFILLPFHDVITVLDMKGLDLRVWLYLFLGATHILRVNIRNITPSVTTIFDPLSEKHLF